jgi:hypothetical protein
MPSAFLPRRDPLSAALLAAELNEPFDLTQTPPVVFAELFASVKALRASVPFATFRLLSRLASDTRDLLREGAARALTGFTEIYPARVEETLLILACDSSRRVRTAAAETLARLLPLVPDIADRWRWHPDRAVAVLDRARRFASQKG